MTRLTPNSESLAAAVPLPPPPAVPPAVMRVAVDRGKPPKRHVNGSGAAEGDDAEKVTEEVLRRAPPWLVSAAFHMLLLIVLGIWFFSTGDNPALTLNLRYDERFGDQLDEQTVEMLADDPLLDQALLLTPDDLNSVEDPFAAPQLVELSPLATASASALQPQPLGMALSGREQGSKESLLRAYGGDATTEAAVMEALRWLARNQQTGGTWSLAGPYQDGANVENRKAATAMALLAFQGAGYTHRGSQAEPFNKIVARGINALLQLQETDGSFLGEFYHHRLYTHAMCTIAICELYAMTGDEALRKPAEDAVAYCLTAQSPLGGWRYSPGNQSDLSVTGWFVMALKSAQMAGLEVPSITFARIEEFLDSVAHADGARYSYLPTEKPKRSMTAEGLLCRQYLGWSRNHPQLIDGVEHLLANPVNWNDRDVYYWYYATQVCHHMEGDYWNQWNTEMKRVLPLEQVKSGRERGSWDTGDDPYGFQAGRLYVTCLSVYMLEVYYRHLPLYRQTLNR